MSYEVKRAYAKFFEKIRGRVNIKGNFVPSKPKELKNAKHRYIRKG